MILRGEDYFVNPSDLMIRDEARVVNHRDAPPGVSANETTITPFVASKISPAGKQSSRTIGVFLNLAH